jgi:NAD(P)-dependent dehydrogenase (short-subunit alcohol dehydrogenase family)
MGDAWSTDGISSAGTKTLEAANAAVMSAPERTNEPEESPIQPDIASIAGKTASTIYHPIYNVSKAAVIAMTKTLAMAHAADGVRVNAVCPGSVSTPMLREVADVMSQSTGKDAATLFAGMVPAQLGRHVEPLEVGRIVAFLLTDAAVIIRGQSINVDAGDTPY